MENRLRAMQAEIDHLSQLNLNMFKENMIYRLQISSLERELRHVTNNYKERMYRIGTVIRTINEALTD